MAATILLVDSDTSNRSGWKAFLQDQGYRVFEVRNGKAAIEQCPLLQPDLVLLNDSLADMQGFQVCQQLKSDPLNKLTPVILLALSTSGEESLRATVSGADEFWNKPASRWEALNRVQSILQLKTYIDQQAEEVILSLARSIEAKNSLTTGHSERLSGYTVQFGRLLGLSECELQNLRMGSLLHDVGKVAVPDTILLKPGKLTRPEAQIMRRHPVVGEEICAPLKSLRDVLPIIRHHHERADGSGYPDGMAGDAIPLSALIVQLADIYDALTMDRPYRQALAKTEALAVMAMEARHGLLDEALVMEFARFVETVLPWQAKPQSMLRSYMAN